MKKTILTSLLAISLGLLHAQIAIIPDAAFKAKLLQSSPANDIAKDMNGNNLAIDANNDNEIQISEAEQVGALKIAYGNNQIHTFTGIEYFSNLVTFTCPGNYQLDSLSVNGMQHLTTLVASANPYLKKIVVTDNPVLIKLNLYDAASFFPDLDELDTLICRNNNLDSLVFVAPTIEYLDCSHNAISAFGPGILHTKYLDISYNNITNLDLRNMYYLQYFFFQNNPLQSIIFRNNNLPGLDISDFSDLAVIDLNNGPGNAKKLVNLTLANLPSLTSLECSDNGLSQLTLADFPLLSHFEAKGMSIDLTLNNLPGITDINFPDFDKINGLSISELDNVHTIKIKSSYDLDLSHLSVTSMQQLSHLDIRYFDTDLLYIHDLPALDTLEIYPGQALPTLTINGFPNLEYLNIICLVDTHTMGFNDLPLLKTLVIKGFNITGLDIQDMPSLTNLDLQMMPLETLTLQNLPALHDLFLFLDTEPDNLVITGLPSLYNFYYKSSLTDMAGSLLTLGELPELHAMTIENVRLTKLEISGLDHLYSISLIQLFNVDTLTFNNLPKLHDLTLYRNRLNKFKLDGFPELTSLSLIENNHDNYIDELAFFEISNLPSLSYLELNTNSNIKPGMEFYINNFPSLYTFYFNQSYKLHLNNLPSLYNLSTQMCYSINSDLQGGEINLVNFPNLHSVEIYNTGAHSNVNLIDLPNLNDLKISISIKNIDMSSCPNIKSVDIESWVPIDFVNLRNGNNLLEHFSSFGFITSICVDDDSEKLLIQSLAPNLYNSAYTQNCPVTQNSHYNSINGVVNYDYDNNGCQTTYTSSENIMMNIISGNTNEISFTNTEGEYKFISQKLNENITLTPLWEDPYFIFDPVYSSTSFSTFGNEVTYNFCAEPNGIYNDLDIVFIPVTAARPGFDAVYKLVYRNKGNITLSGEVELFFNDNVLDLVTALPNYTSQNTNSLVWEFINLLPFTSGEILVTFNLNSPTETPPLNSGDILNFTAIINSPSGEETPGDNTFSYNQGVVNSFDPNDKICLEGETINLISVGDYVHYMIHFENTGNADAINIMVKDIIDTTKFDINSLIPVSASHTFNCNVKNGNRVEFAFTGINLSPEDPENTGYVLFKIKTKGNLQVDDTLANKADIYFDYNAPVYTNEYITAIALNVGLTDYSIENIGVLVYPNPATDLIKIQTEGKIQRIEIFDISGRIVKSNSNSSEISTAFLNQGVYFVRVYIHNKPVTKKIIKM